MFKRFKMDQLFLNHDNIVAVEVNIVADHVLIHTVSAQTFTLQPPGNLTAMEYALQVTTEMNKAKIALRNGTMTLDATPTQQPR